MNLIPTRFFSWLFEPLDPEAKPVDALLWWERRRLAYNILVLIWGIIGLLTCFLSLADELYLPPDAPLGLLQFIASSAIMINLCYTLGWIVAMPGAWLAPESKEWLSPLLMKWGLALTALVIAAPPMLLMVVLALDFLFGSP